PQQQDRLPVASVIHNEVYHDYSAEEIRAYYSFKEQLESSRKFVEENGKTSLAQVYTDVRYKKADNEFFSGKFLEVLKEQGFLK
ncbi:MAG TPA: NADPH-dependent oxidoreductase, partial [Prolixibacteraceae bacterium]|nr:NADPH-dependent oxidoreductase [Prolixibacteraceae bacterium]